MVPRVLPDSVPKDRAAAVSHESMYDKIALSLTGVWRVLDLIGDTAEPACVCSK